METEDRTPEAAPEPFRPTRLWLFQTFFRIGSLAFGGGGSTLSMMHAEFCVRRPVVDNDEFQALFGLSRMTPGMNLLSLTVLLGYRTHALGGALIALAGLTIPCFLLITGACLLFRGGPTHPVLSRAVRGLGPAVVVLLGATLWQMSEPTLRRRTGLERACWLGIAAVTTAVAAARLLHPTWLLVASIVAGILLAPRLKVGS